MVICPLLHLHTKEVAKCCCCCYGTNKSWTFLKCFNSNSPTLVQTWYLGNREIHQLDALPLVSATVRSIMVKSTKTGEDRQRKLLPTTCLRSLFQGWEILIEYMTSYIQNGVAYEIYNNGDLISYVLLIFIPILWKSNRPDTNTIQTIVEHSIV